MSVRKRLFSTPKTALFARQVALEARKVALLEC